MTPTLSEEFKTRFEDVKGIVHFADSWASAVDICAQICAAEEASCVALGELPASFAATTAERLSSNGTTVLQPPYAHETLPEALDKADIGIGSITFGISSTGTLVEVALDDSIRLVSSLPRVYIGILEASSLVLDFEAAAPKLRAVFEDNTKNCVVSFISGPSRTGDIEMILTLGVHGPETAHAIVIGDPQEGQNV